MRKIIIWSLGVGLIVLSILIMNKLDQFEPAAVSNYEKAVPFTLLFIGSIIVIYSSFFGSDN